MSQPDGLSVALTGPTGTLGAGLVPLLEDDDRVRNVTGVARRPFDPAEHGWSKLRYQQGDVRNQDMLETAFHGADVVVHLAFLVVRDAPEPAARQINVDGTLNAFRAAAAAGVRRFVYASSLAAYGFRPDNPRHMSEEWPTRPAKRLRYSRDKAQIEAALRQEAERHPQVELYVLRPCAVVGPRFIGAKDPAWLRWLTPHLRDETGRLQRLRIPVPVLAPAVDFQLVHEDDVGQAFLQCVLGAGPTGAYNIAGDGSVTVADVARELGALPIPLPAAAARVPARAAIRLPLPSPAGWVEFAVSSALQDTTKARTELGWKPQYTSLEALRDTIAGHNALAPAPAADKT
jgi:nucleoside-diphosphate-sugar epimerase